MILLYKSSIFYVFYCFYSHSAKLLVQENPIPAPVPPKFPDILLPPVEECPVRFVGKCALLAGKISPKNRLFSPMIRTQYPVYYISYFHIYIPYF